MIVSSHRSSLASGGAGKRCTMPTTTTPPRHNITSPCERHSSDGVLTHYDSYDGNRPESYDDERVPTPRCRSLFDATDYDFAPWWRQRLTDVGGGGDVSINDAIVEALHYVPVYACCSYAPGLPAIACAVRAERLGLRIDAEYAATYADSDADDAPGDVLIKVRGVDRNDTVAMRWWYTSKRVRCWGVTWRVDDAVQRCAWAERLGVQDCSQCTWLSVEYIHGALARVASRGNEGAAAEVIVAPSIVMSTAGTIVRQRQPSV